MAGGQKSKCSPTQSSSPCQIGAMGWKRLVLGRAPPLSPGPPPEGPIYRERGTRPLQPAAGTGARWAAVLRHKEKPPFRLSPRSHGVPSGPNVLPGPAAAVLLEGLLETNVPRVQTSESTRAPGDGQALRGSRGSSARFLEDPPARTRRKWARMTPGCPSFPPGHSAPRAPGGSRCSGADERLQHRPGRRRERRAQPDPQPEPDFQT